MCLRHVTALVLLTWAAESLLAAGEVENNEIEVFGRNVLPAELCRGGRKPVLGPHDTRPQSREDQRKRLSDC